MLLTQLKGSFERQVRRPRDWTLPKFLEEYSSNQELGASTASRIYEALCPEAWIKTASHPRLLRLFGDRILKWYPAFDDFYGLETVIEQIVQHYYLAAQGLDMRKKILCLIGPPGTAKSMLARRINMLFGQTSMYVLAIKDKDNNFIPSPVFEHPFDLFNRDEHGNLVSQYGIKPYQLGMGGPSPWAWDQLRAFDGDITRFHVVQVPCSVGQQAGIARIEPQSEKQFDSTVLIGARNEDGSYRYTGGLNRAGQGVLEFVEMFKAPADLLRSLLTAMEEGSYAGHGGIGPIPFRGVVYGHSNPTEWDKFKNNSDNEGLVDRIRLIEVPYGLRATEEKRIYDRMVGESELAEKPQAPGTTDALSHLTVLSRLRPAGNSNPTVEIMRVYDGEDPKKISETLKTLAEYRSESGEPEGKKGISPRSGYQIISGAYTGDPNEIGIDPLLVFEEARKVISRDYKNDSSRYKKIIEDLEHKYLITLERDIEQAYAKSRGGDTPQERFNRYDTIVRYWYYSDETYKDPVGDVWDSVRIDKELRQIEEAMKITDASQFRDDVAKHCAKYRSTHGNGAEVPWESHEYMKKLIEAQMLSEGTNFAQVIAFGDFKRDEKVQKAHDTFVECMVERGYSKRQTERLVGWYMAQKGLSYFDSKGDEKKK